MCESERADACLRAQSVYRLRGMRVIRMKVGAVGALLALLTISVAPVLVAAERNGAQGLRRTIERTRRLVIVIFSRIGLPPG
jgi:hypothetical protein